MPTNTLDEGFFYANQVRKGPVMKKVVIIGCGGSGKSTFARKLGEILHLPVYHLDALYWKPGWVATPNEEWERIQRELVQKDKWIIDGNYGRTLNIRLAEADTILFFDLSRWITTYRIFKRRIMYHGRTRPDLNEGCPEQLDFQFIKWVWNFRRDKRPGLIEALTTYRAAKKIIVLRKPSEVNKLLEQMQRKEEIGSHF